MQYKLSLFIFLSFSSLFAETQNLPDLIKQLGAENFRERKLAEKLLWEAAPKSILLLEKAAKSTDPEVSFRAKRILEKISKGIFPGLPKELEQKISEFWTKKDNERIKFFVSLYSSEGSKSFPLIYRLALLAKRNNQTVKLERLFQMSTFKNELAEYDDVETSYNLFKLYAEEGFPADFIMFAVHRGKIAEEVKFYKQYYESNNSFEIEKVYLALCRAHNQKAKVIDLSNAKGKSSTAAKMVKLENYELPLLIEKKDSHSDLALKSSELFVDKFLNNKSINEAKLKNLIKNHEESNQEKLIDYLLLLGERSSALKLALRHSPAQAINILASAGDIQQALQTFKKHSDSLQVKLAIAKVFQSYSADKQIKEILNSEMLSSLPKKDLEAFIIPYSLTLQKDTMLETLAELLSQNSSNLYTIKRTLATHYKLSPYFLWNYLGETDNTRLQNFYRLVQKEFSEQELQDLIKNVSSKLNNNTGLAYNLSVTCRLYDKAEQADTFLEYSRNCGYTLYFDILQLIKNKQWQLAYDKLKAAEFDTYYKSRQSFFTALCMKKLKLPGHEALMRQALVGGKASTYSRITFLTDLIKANLKEESDLYSNAIIATLYTEKSSNLLRNAFLALSSLAELQGKHEEAYQKKVLATAIYIQTSRSNVSLNTLRYTTNIFESQFNLAKNTDQPDLAFSAAQNYLNSYIQKSEFTEQAISFLVKKNRQKDADSLYQFTNDKFNQALKIFPQSGTIHNNKAWNSALCNKNFDIAEKEVKQALTLEPKNAHYWDTLAEIYLRQNKLDESLKISEKAYMFSYGEVSFRDRHNDFINRIQKLRKN